MAKQFQKNELICQGNKYGIFIKEDGEKFEVLDSLDNSFYFYSPSKLTKQETKERIANLKKEIEFIQKYSC